MSEAEKPENEGRLSRWSRRKLSAAKGELVDQEEDAAAADEMPLPNNEETAEKQAELLANREAAEAVDLETLDQETDFSVFMKEGVPELLKKRAMAALWRSNPVFANIDGLNDYDDDFANPKLNMKTFQSAYEVGKGYFFPEKDEEEELATEVLDTTGAMSGEPNSKDDEAEISNDDVVEITDPEEAVSVDETDEHSLHEEEQIVSTPKVSLRRRFELES